MVNNSSAEPLDRGSGKGLIMKNISLLGAGAILAAFSVPAAASTVVVASCQDLSVTGNSCLFNGNINENTNPGNANSHKNAEAAYNALAFSDITLDFLTASDLGGFGGFGSATGNGPTLITSTSGTWSLPGYSVEYIAVKAGPQFVLYNVGGVSSGNWSTAFLVNNQGNMRQLSHLSFFGSLAAAVPEPSAWALMILGFGVAGAAMRQQRKARVRFA